jgi:RND superfamily putative drug exporter
MQRLTRFITAKKTSWIVLLIAVAVSAAIFTLGSGSTEESAPGVGLPDSAESARVAALQERLPGADSTSALLVFSRDGDELDEADVTAVTAATRELAEVSLDGFVPPPSVSEDGTAALVVVPLEDISDVAAQAERAADLRETANADLPDGLTALLTGPEGFAVDVAAVFKGADFTLLLTTVLVVAVLLLITYRSPWLWLVPLTVVGLADGLAAIVATRIAAAPASRSTPRSPASCRCSSSARERTTRSSSSRGTATSFDSWRTATSPWRRPSAVPDLRSSRAAARSC